MFCPNCGTQNENAASPCKKCGFKLSGVSAPKFKGTMMLNSEQTVQDLIEEHKKKRAEAGLDDSSGSEPAAPVDRGPGAVPPKAPLSVPPPSSASAPRSVLQPPRASTTKRRMGGTMLGVAPQVGGVSPPLDLTVTPPRVQPIESVAQAAATVERSEPLRDESPHASPRRGPDPLAGTVAMPIVSSNATTPVQSGVARTQPLPEVHEVAPPPPVTHETDAYGTDADGTDAEGADAEGARARRAQAVTAALQTQEPPSVAAAASLDDAPHPPRSGIRPFEIVLIVATCGLYGLFLLFRQRKSPSH